jgi:hypothetical protein
VPCPKEGPHEPPAEVLDIPDTVRSYEDAGHTDEWTSPFTCGFSGKQI